MSPFIRLKLSERGFRPLIFSIFEIILSKKYKSDRGSIASDGHLALFSVQSLTWWESTGSGLCWHCSDSPLGSSLCFTNLNLHFNLRFNACNGISHFSNLHISYFSYLNGYFILFRSIIPEFKKINFKNDFSACR